LQQASANIDFESPRRQNAIAVLLLFLNNLRSWAAALLPIIFLAGKNSGSGIFYLFLFIGIGIFVLLAFVGFSIAQYQRFVFYVKDNHFVLEKGVISRTKVEIPVERIQSIHLKRNIFHRIFNITALQVESAGSKGAELEIKALDQPFAASLRNFLYETKKGLKTQQDAAIVDSVVPESTDNQTVEIEDEPVKPLLRLSALEVLLVGLTENHLRTGFLALAIVFGYGNQLIQYMEDQLDEYLKEGAEQIAKFGFNMIVLGIVLFMVVSVLLSIIRTALKFANFKAWHKADVLNIQTGLLSIKEYQVPKRKIQYIRKSTNPLRRLLGICTMRIYQASSDVVLNNNVEMPGFKENSLSQLYEEYLPETNAEIIWELHPDTFYRFRFILFRSIPLLGLIIAGAILLNPYIALSALLVIPGIIYWAIRYHDSIRLKLYAEGMKVESGWIFREVIDIPIYKLQNFSLKQSIFQERRDLFSLNFHTSSGTISFPFLKKEEAYSLVNHLTEQVEKSNRKWM
jgi:putative membrane protein